MLENLKVLWGGSAKAHLPRFFFMSLVACSCIWQTFIHVFGGILFRRLADFAYLRRAWIGSSLDFWIKILDSMSTFFECTTWMLCSLFNDGKDYC